MIVLSLWSVCFAQQVMRWHGIYDTAWAACRARGAGGELGRADHVTQKFRQDSVARGSRLLTEEHEHIKQVLM